MSGKLCLLCRKRPVYGRVLTCANCLLEKHLKELGLGFTSEFRFYGSRLWRADYLLDLLLNGQSVLLEIEGGTFAKGRHTRGTGFEDDCRKYNKAQALGYYVIRFTTNMVQRGESKAFLAEHVARIAANSERKAS